MIINFLQICLIIGALAFIITLMVKQDLKDENDTINKKIAEIKSVTEVDYFESMQPNKKLNKITEELNKIEKMITLEPDLNDFYACLKEVRLLKCKVDKVYDNGRIQFNNAISWLEKPRTIRGKYKPVPYDEDKTVSLDINNVKDAVRLIIVTKPNSVMKSIDSVDDFISDDYEFDQKCEKSVFKNTSKTKFNIPEIKLQNVLEVKHTINKYWPQVEFWFFELFYDVLQSIKIWYAIFIIVRRSIFNWNNLENVINSVSNRLEELIIIQTNFNKKDDVTTIILNIFPKKIEKSKSRLERVWAFFKKLWT